IPELTELMRQYIVDFYGKAEPEPGAVEGLIRHLLDHPEQGRQFVAVRDGRAVGFATLYFTFSTLQVKRAAILNDLFVAEAARRDGVGERLFRACLDHIREQGMAYMQWETARDNDAAQRFYAKM